MKSNNFIFFVLVWLLCPLFLYAGEPLGVALDSEQEQIRGWLNYIQKDVLKRQDLTTDPSRIYLLLQNHDNLPAEHMQQTQQDIKNYFGAGLLYQFLLRVNVKSVAFVDSEGDCYLYTSRLISACGRQTAAMMEQSILTLSGSQDFIKKTVQSSDLDQGRVGYQTLAPCSTPGSCAAPADSEERSAQEVICDSMKDYSSVAILAAGIGTVGWIFVNPETVLFALSAVVVVSTFGYMWFGLVCL